MVGDLMEFKIKDININNQVVLAPMAGISNPAYIKICEEMGVGYAVTELISSEAIIRNNKKTLDMLNGIESLNIPVAVQIFGSDPNHMAKAAKMLVDLYNIKIVDINMGCPVPKVALKAESGSALLKNPKKVYDIVKAVVDAVSIPVTVKIRSGWDSNSINAKEIAHMIELAGASAITVHSRTRSQGYSGKADLDVIKDVKQTVSIPVIGNGDIRSCYDAKNMIDYTGCDAIMIGRGLLGNPWLIKECVDYLEKNVLPKKVTPEEKLDMLIYHFNLLIENKNEKLALLEIRSHAAWYLKGIPNTSKLKVEICKVTDKDKFYQLIEDFKKEYIYE
jgi:nifR3 family TIM-barrel protein